MTGLGAFPFPSKVIETGDYDNPIVVGVPEDFPNPWEAIKRVSRYIIPEQRLVKIALSQSASILSPFSSTIEKWAQFYAHRIVLPYGANIQIGVAGTQPADRTITGISSITQLVDQHTAPGGTLSFAISAAPESAAALVVFVDDVFRHSAHGSSAGALEYTVSGLSLVFGANISGGAVVRAIQGYDVVIATPDWNDYIIGRDQCQISGTTKILSGVDGSCIEGQWPVISKGSGNITVRVQVKHTHTPDWGTYTAGNFTTRRIPAVWDINVVDPGGVGNVWGILLEQGRLEFINMAIRIRGSYKNAVGMAVDGSGAHIRLTTNAGLYGAPSHGMWGFRGGTWDVSQGYLTFHGENGGYMGVRANAEAESAKVAACLTGFSLDVGGSLQNGLSRVRSCAVQAIKLGLQAGLAGKQDLQCNRGGLLISHRGAGDIASSLIKNNMDFGIKGADLGGFVQLQGGDARSNNRFGAGNYDIDFGEGPLTVAYRLGQTSGLTISPGHTIETYGPGGSILYTSDPPAI